MHPNTDQVEKSKAAYNLAAENGVDGPRQSRFEPEDLLPTATLATALYKSPRTLESWRVSGVGPPFIRVGPRQVAYRWRDVQEWLDGRVVTSTSQEAA